MKPACRTGNETVSDADGKCANQTAAHGTGGGAELINSREETLACLANEVAPFRQPEP
jgi:hypothetical protein